LRRSAAGFSRTVYAWGRLRRFFASIAATAARVQKPCRVYGKSGCWFWGAYGEMQSETGGRCNFADVDQALVPDARSRRLFGGAALTYVAALCAWTIASNLYGNGSDGSDADAFAARFEAAATRAEDIAGRGDTLASSVAARLAAMTPSSLALSDAYPSLFDRRFSLGYSPGTFIGSSAALMAQQQAASAARAGAGDSRTNVKRRRSAAGDAIGSAAAPPVFSPHRLAA
jgi:hypothetical protein